MAEVTYYLRPTGDVSVMHYIDDDIEAMNMGAFPALNEEVKDTASIWGSQSKDNREYYSTFIMTGGSITIPTNKVYSKMTLYVYTSDGLNDKFVELGDEAFSVSVNGVSEYVGGSKDKAGLMSFDLPNSLNTFNNYISTNKTIPEVRFTIYTYWTGYGDNKTVGNQRHYYQAYLELTIGDGVYYKMGDNWVKSIGAYRHIDGSWQQISNDELKTLISTNKIKAG